MKEPTTSSGRVGARAALALISGAAVASPLVVGLPATGALAKCEPPRVNDNQYYHDGWYRNDPGGGVVGGVYSKILNYSPWVEPNSGGEQHFAAAWTMLTRTGQPLWAQVGWWEDPFGVRHTFVQHTYAPGQKNTYMEWGSEPVGSYSYYTTLIQGIDFVFQLNGTTIKTVRGNFTPNEGEIAGEINTFASQMPGGSNSKEVFDDSHVWLSGAWGNFSGTPWRTSSEFGYNKQSALRMDIWDTECTS